MADKGTKPLKAITTKQTKAQIVGAICEETGLAKRDVVAVLATLGAVAKRHLMKKGSGEFTVPELAIKLRRITKPATKARKGRNPFTGEEITIKAKPARNSVRATPLKALKEAIA
jgi:nucleoid DNA-binding protein